MNEGLISVRYATALFSLAKEKKLLPAIKEDMELIMNVCSRSADFSRMLGSPVVKPSEKISVIKLIFDKKINILSINLLELIVKNNREAFIPSICRVILSYIRKEKGIKTAVITTARPLDEATMHNVVKALEKELGARVELTGKANPSVIGGLVLRIDDRQYDATVKTRLKKLKQELMKTKL